MRLGISSYAFTWAIGVPGYAVESPMSVFQLLEEAVKLNVTCVQIADNIPLHQFSDVELAALKKQADSAGLAIEIGTRGLQPENIRQYLDIAAWFQSPILRVVIDAVDFQPTIPEIIEILRKINPWLEQQNIKLAIENHDRFKAHEFLQMLEGANSEFIGICLDSVNSLGAGEGVHVVTELLGPFTYNLHVKEFIVRRLDHKMGFLVEGRPAGQGMLPLEWMLSKINPQCTSAILEQWVPPETMIEETCAKEREWAQISIEYLKKFFYK
ncbi:sugar phosphate isomerase/epimerase [candidate division KSB1 bacterium]|nr:sugar phosphate isomerase/epimerase [candidate division KSB1 bacterium]